MIEELRLRVVAAEPKDGLREIVRPKREELRDLGDLIGHQAGARDLDHGAEEVAHRHPGLLHDLRRDGHQLLVHKLQLIGMAHQWNHDLRDDVDALVALHLDRRQEDGADLHLIDLGIEDTQPAPAQAQHWIELVQHLHPAQQRFFLLQPIRLAARSHLGDFDEQIFHPRQELMQGRVQETDNHRPVAHLAKDSFEVFLLEEQQPVQRRPPLSLRGRHDHLLHDRQPLGFHKHMLGPAQTDPFRAKL